MTKLLGPLQVKVEEWKKTTGALEREHDKGTVKPKLDPLNKRHRHICLFPYIHPLEMYTRQREWDFMHAGLLTGVPWRPWPLLELAC